MYTLSLHTDARDDLEALWTSDPDTAAYIEALLEQIKADQHLLDMLTAHDFGKDGNELFHASKWVELFRQQMDIWRIKAWELEKLGIRYRIVYALEQGKGRYHVLAIAPRSFDYDRNHPISQRILAAYAKLGLNSSR